jgi:hypothetical protein
MGREFEEGHMIPEHAIRLSSYLIWEKAGCPDGKALEHWQQARDELEGEFAALLSRFDDCERTVVPRVPIRRPPQRLTSARVPAGEWRAAIAAR